MRNRLLTPTAPFILFGLMAILMGAGPDDPISVEAVRAAVAGARVSTGPEASKTTRSPWGPTLYRSTVDSVVLVYVKDQGLGSGVMVSPSCRILTNWHVVKDAKVAAIVLRRPALKTLDMLTDDDVRAAHVLKTSQPQDLALLKLDRCPAAVRYLTLADPAQVEVGQDVFAIGHPEELFWTYTEGVISQIRPRAHWKVDDREYLATLLQTQTPISFGSSGGPLINQAGKIVGIVSNSLEDRAGFNFAIAVHELISFLRE